jgi:hypothetical protein
MSPANSIVGTRRACEYILIFSAADQPTLARSRISPRLYCGESAEGIWKLISHSRCITLRWGDACG